MVRDIRLLMVSLLSAYERYMMHNNRNLMLYIRVCRPAGGDEPRWDTEWIRPKLHKRIKGERNMISLSTQ